MKELYDRDRRVDENIFHLPSEGTMPMSKYTSRYTGAQAVLSKQPAPTDDLTPFLESTQEVITGVISGLTEAFKDTIAHVTNSNPTSPR
jgi:hypothetical protein